MATMNIFEMLSNFSKENTKCILCVSRFETPIGKVIAGADNVFLYFVAFEDSVKLQNIFTILSKELNCKFVNEKNEVLCTFEKELNEYFSGTLLKFNSPIKIFGSKFQNDVWHGMQTVPYAKTETYGGLANNIGKTASYARAVGMACGANNHILVVPCHRVVARNSNGGFSSGIERKKWLLEHEQKYYK